MGKEKACSGDATLSGIIEGVLAHCYELWFLMCLCWEMIRHREQIPEFYSRIIVGVSGMQTKEEFVYDLYISQNIRSMSLRRKLRMFQGALIWKENVLKEIVLKLI